MQDQSHLDRKYFIDKYVYNCPFCNRNHVSYKIASYFSFNWSKEVQCWGYLVKCESCAQQSMHLAHEDIADDFRFYDDIDIDASIFYSVPTSFFVIDNRIPRVIRELITEAEGCVRMNYLTGASACARKAIYELTVKEEAAGDHYEDKIKSLKEKYPGIDPNLFDILAAIQGMTSDNVHEQSWPKWDSAHLTLIIETLKDVLREVYVLPRIKEGKSQRIQQLQQAVKTKGQSRQPGTPPAQNGGEA